MKIDIQLLDGNSDPELRAQLQNKILQFESVYDSVVDGKMCFWEDKTEEEKDKMADILIRLPDNVFYAEGRSENFKEACDVAIKEVRKQLRKYKASLAHKISDKNSLA